MTSARGIAVWPVQRTEDSNTGALCRQRMTARTNVGPRRQNGRIVKHVHVHDFGNADDQLLRDRSGGQADLSNACKLLTVTCV